MNQPERPFVEKKPLRGVVFDLGGVVLGSPLHAIARYERELGLEHNTVNRHVAASAPSGVWHRMERGELSVGEEFFRLFDAELAADGIELSSEAMMAEIAKETEPRPVMLEAIARLRQAGYRVAALTNNWNDDRDAGKENDNEKSSFKRKDLHERFEFVVESALEGVRKPDPLIYQITCERLGLQPEECAFLDDIGSNLKSARQLGFVTIKVDDPVKALRQLEGVVGIELVGDVAATTA